MCKIPVVLAIFIFFTTCTSNSDEYAQEVVNQAIAKHGGDHFNGSRISFQFRDKMYAADRRGGKYTYTRSFNDPRGRIVDVLINSTDFTRMVNGDTIILHDTIKSKYTSSVNSVLYFIQLPYLLNDPAAIKKYLGTAVIDDEPYHSIKVTFDPESGGEDFEDEYVYWIHQKDHTLDYFAYSYQTDGGGARFRKAYNRMEKGGILFQDYINYAVPAGIPLNEIPEQYEAGKLKELSRIKNQDIKVEKL